MRVAWLSLLAVAGACILHASDADACAVAYPEGTFVRLTKEQTLVVWDDASKTEHLVRKPVFDGDPESFGFFVPTPALPEVGKVDGALFERVDELVRPPPPPQASGSPSPLATGGGQGAPPAQIEVQQTVTLGDFELVSLKAADERALGEWLGKHGFGDRPELRAWTKPYVERGWTVNAMRFAGSKARARNQVEVPTVRLTFHAEEPFYPYTEPPEDPAHRQAFAKRYVACPPGDPLCNPAWFAPRSLDVWVVAPSAMQATLAGKTHAPFVVRSVRVGAAALGEALGDTKAWGFRPAARETWVLTHLRETTTYRGGGGDLSFAAYDIPEPRRGKGVDPAWVPPPKLAWSAPAPAAHPGKRRASKRTLALGGLGVGLLLVVLFALRAAQGEKRDPS